MGNAYYKTAPSYDDCKKRLKQFLGYKHYFEKTYEHTLVDEIDSRDESNKMFRSVYNISSETEDLETVIETKLLENITNIISYFINLTKTILQYNCNPNDPECISEVIERIHTRNFLVSALYDQIIYEKLNTTNKSSEQLLNPTIIEPIEESLISGTEISPDSIPSKSSIPPIPPFFKDGVKNKHSLKVNTEKELKDIQTYNPFKTIGNLKELPLSIQLNICFIYLKYYITLTLLIDDFISTLLIINNITPISVPDFKTKTDTGKNSFGIKKPKSKQNLCRRSLKKKQNKHKSITRQKSPKYRRKSIRHKSPLKSKTKKQKSRKTTTKRSIHKSKKTLRKLSPKNHRRSSRK